MKYTNIFYAKYPSRDKQYIFELPDLNIKISKGDKLRILGKHGESDVIATSESLIVTEDVAEATASAMGGYWPLAQAYGKIECVNVEQFSPFVCPF